MTEQSCVYGGEELAYGQDNCMTSQVKGTGRFMYLMLLVQERSMVLSLHLSQCPRKGDKALRNFNANISSTQFHEELCQHTLKDFSSRYKDTALAVLHIDGNNNGFHQNALYYPYPLHLFLNFLLLLLLAHFLLSEFTPKHHVACSCRPCTPPPPRSLLLL